MNHKMKNFKIPDESKANKESIFVNSSLIKQQKSKILRTIIFFTCILFSIQDISSQTKIKDADNFYYNCSYQEAKKSYNDVYNNPNATDTDRVKAGRRLAYLSWHIAQNLEDARNYINSSLNYKIDEANLLVNLSKYETEANNFSTALDLCKKALKYSDNNVLSNLIKIREAGIYLEEAIFNIENGKQFDHKKIKNALNKIIIINRNEPGLLKANEIQLGLALLLKNGKAAFEAWKGYFRIPQHEKAKGILQPVEENLQKVLLGMEEDNFSNQMYSELIIQLANSRFYNYANLLSLINKNTQNKNNENLNDIINYYSFCKSADLLSENYHRSIALNGLTKQKRKDFYTKLLKIKKNLWNKLSWNNKIKKFSNSNFKDELYSRFGTIFKDVKPYYVYPGKTGLFLFAHTISDDNINVKQYGYETSVHFVNLDFMYANSFDGWFRGSQTGNLGGWNEKSMIVQMRRAYTAEPVFWWNRISQKQLSNNFEKRIEKLSLKDEEIAKNNPVVYLPGLVNRMRYNSCIRLKDSLIKKGYQGSQLRMAFITNFQNYQINASIFGHEGRHVIDRKYRLIFEPTCKNFEYRAKLSEIIFSDDPFFTMGFSSVYMRSLGSRGKHSKGSLKIINNLVIWMEKNKDNIKGINTEKPLLTQLDLLSDYQLVSAFQSMDPLYKKRSKKIMRTK